MADEKVCEHDLCNCQVKGDADYCSSYCEGAGDADVSDLASAVTLDVLATRLGPDAAAVKDNQAKNKGEAL